MEKQSNWPMHELNATRNFSSSNRVELSIEVNWSNSIEIIQLNNFEKLKNNYKLMKGEKNIKIKGKSLC